MRDDCVPLFNDGRKKKEKKIRSECNLCSNSKETLLFPVRSINGVLLIENSSGKTDSNNVFLKSTIFSISITRWWLIQTTNNCAWSIKNIQYNSRLNNYGFVTLNSNCWDNIPYNIHVHLDQKLKTKLCVKNKRLYCWICYTYFFKVDF